MGAFDNMKEMGRMKKLMDDAKKQLNAMRAVGVSRRGFVKITLDGEKTIKHLEFSDLAMQQSKEELAKLVKDAHKAAAKDIDKQNKKQMKNSELASMFNQK